MTLVLAFCCHDAVVLAADSRVGDGAGQRREDDKIWQLQGRYGVVAYGCGPPGVPSAISSFDSVGPTTKATTEGLTRRLGLLPHAGDWAIVVAGHDPDGFTVAQGALPSGRTQLLNRPARSGARGWWYGGSVDPSAFPHWQGNSVLDLPAEEVARYAFGLLIHAGTIDANRVGAPYRALLLRSGGVEWVSSQVGEGEHAVEPGGR